MALQNENAITHDPPALPALPRESPAELHVGFIMSTEVGLRTQFLNWREGLTPDLGIRPEWIVVDWWKHGGTIERAPMVPDAVKARMRAELQFRSGMRKGPFDALFIAQDRMLHAANALLFRQPFFITADVTARQLAAFGPLYNKEQWGPALYEDYKHRERSERLKRANAVFPWSNWAAQSMVEDYGADPARIHVVPPGVDVDKWSAPVRPSCGDSKPVDILFVGSDFYRKGGDLLIRWAKTTRARDWRLHIVTRDLIVPPHPAVKLYQRLQPNVPELMRLYEQADIFALPTRGDCYSLAAIEAMAAGLPVVLSRTGGTPDIVDDAETGFLIDPGDAGALAERLDYLIHDPNRRAALGAAGRAVAEARFDARKNIRATIRHLRDHMD